MQNAHFDNSSQRNSIAQPLPSSEGLQRTEMEEALELENLLQDYRKTLPPLSTTLREEDADTLRKETLKLHAYLLFALNSQLKVAEGAIKGELYKKIEERALFNELQKHTMVVKEYLYKEALLPYFNAKIDNPLTNTQINTIWDYYKQLENIIFALRIQLLEKTHIQAQISKESKKNRRSSQLEPLSAERKNQEYSDAFNELQFALGQLTASREIGLAVWQSMILIPNPYYQGQKQQIKSLKSLMKKAIWDDTADQKLKHIALDVNKINRLAAELAKNAQNTATSLQEITNSIQLNLSVNTLAPNQYTSSEKKRSYLRLKKYIDELNARQMLDTALQKLQQTQDLDEEELAIIEKIKAEEQQKSPTNEIQEYCENQLASEPQPRIGQRRFFTKMDKIDEIPPRISKHKASSSMTRLLGFLGVKEKENPNMQLSQTQLLSAAPKSESIEVVANPLFRANSLFSTSTTLLSEVHELELSKSLDNIASPGSDKDPNRAQPSFFNARGKNKARTSPEKKTYHQRSKSQEIATSNTFSSE